MISVSELYMLANAIIVFLSIVFFNPWSMVAGLLAFMNFYGQYQIWKLTKQGEN